jgi:hypothetical protein
MANLSTTVQWDTIRSLTHPKVAQKISDNITKQIPLIYLLNKIGHKEYENGGYNYVFPVLKEFPNVQGYTGLQVLDSQEADPVTSAIYERKQLTVPVMLSGTKLLQNSGSDPTAIVNYIAAQIEIAEEAMKNAMASSSIGIYSTLVETDMTGITGLGSILGTNASTLLTTGLVGGLDRATYTWWRQQNASVTTGFSTSTSGLNAFRNLFINTFRGDEAPSVINTTLSTYVNLEIATTGTVTFNTPSPKTQFGDVGFEHMMFHGALVIPDANIASNTGYFMNLKYLKLIVHQERDMVIRDFIAPENQDGLLGRIYWAGNLCCTNLARQGLLSGVPDTA